MLSYFQFEKVFVVSMPARTDKRDAVSISAAMTDFRFDWVDGVDGTLVSPKAIPEVRHRARFSRHVTRISIDFGGRRDGMRRTLAAHWDVGEPT